MSFDGKDIAENKKKKWAQSEIPVHDILHKLLNLRHENLPCILDVPSRRA